MSLGDSGITGKCEIVDKSNYKGRREIDMFQYPAYSNKISNFKPEKATSYQIVVDGLSMLGSC